MAGSRLSSPCSPIPPPVTLQAVTSCWDRCVRNGLGFRSRTDSTDPLLQRKSALHGHNSRSSGFIPQLLPLLIAGPLLCLSCLVTAALPGDKPGSVKPHFVSNMVIFPKHSPSSAQPNASHAAPRVGQQSPHVLSVEIQQIWWLWHRRGGEKLAGTSSLFAFHCRHLPLKQCLKGRKVSLLIKAQH